MWVVVDIRMLDIRMLDWPKISMCETSRGYQQARYAVSLIFIQIFTACLTYWLSHIQISMACLTYRYPRPLLHTDIPASSTYRYPRPYIKYIYLPSVSPYGYWFEQDYVRLAVSYNRDHTLNYRTIIYISFDIQLIFYGRIATLC